MPIIPQRKLDIGSGYGLPALLAKSDLKVVAHEMRQRLNWAYRYEQEAHRKGMDGGAMIDH